MENKLFNKVCDAAIGLGAYKASVIPTSEISLDKSFRDTCESNACGVYGKCYMCPPDIGDIDVLINKVGQYDYALVYQTVSELEDSYDFEGMIAAKTSTYPIAQKLRAVFDELSVTKVLHLGAGGCGVCDKCAKTDNLPCRFPELAMPSLEAYGINVSLLSKSAQMKYTNGPNTVTYFGAVLFTI